jgi:Ca-activated chloride channel family protein
MLEFPIKFENPFLGIFGFMIGVLFILLFYHSYKRVRTAEKNLELVKWPKIRRAMNFLNISSKVAMIFALSFLLTLPYFLTSIEVPIENLSEEQLNQSSISVMILLDVSYSMNFSDLKPNRLQVAKQMATLLVDAIRSMDLIGFVSFADRIYDSTLPTLNRNTIKNMIANQTFHNSTSIGTALEATLGMLEVYPSGKSIVLFSDGKNNYGVSNLTAVADTAAAMKIPIFVVFTGTHGIAEVDPLVLENLASISGGEFYDIVSEDVKAMGNEVTAISREVKIGALRTVSDKLTFDARDYSTPLLLFAALLIISLFLTWLTGV